MSNKKTIGLIWMSNLACILLLESTRITCYELLIV